MAGEAAEIREKAGPQGEAAVNDQEQPAGEGTGKKKFGLKLPSLPKIPTAVAKIAVLVLVIAVTAVISFVVITKVLAPRLNAPVDEELIAGEVAPEPETAPSPPPSLIHSVDEIIVNPAGTSGRRFLKVGVTFELEGEGVVEEMAARNPQIRDLLIREFSSRGLEEAVDPVLREEIRESILIKVNEILVNGKALNLYFTDYIVQ
ncbi:MAG: flagellar basal body-associated FliL family protein [Candidatus Eisenbacteria bacterium]|uniref:Flagellar protein FliL n=1 Tax=Eiseniibacteriota bacterium TaxID=2212470 RepID=A0A948RY92_UNCEI|nr:flagellar basal body-associated FliL family protein [Candidatus Eisenbacteria bacterium]MBU2692176.1 flagellar basal body-associated FliL family protein [Candidatus Eisenbacteria bacterium]